MASRGVLQRGLTLLASAAIAALPLASGLTPMAAAPAAHAASAYPNGFGARHPHDGLRLGQDRSFTSAGVANLAGPEPDSKPRWNAHSRRHRSRRP